MMMLYLTTHSAHFEYDFVGKDSDPEVVGIFNNKFIANLLIWIHIAQYFIHEYSVYDIRLNGEPDIFGVYRSKNEIFLRNIEASVVCLVTGFTIYHFVNDQIYYHQFSLLTYPLTVDILIMCLIRPFSYLS